MLLFAGTYDRYIHSFRLDRHTGTLSAAGRLKARGNPAALALHPRLPVVYAVHEQENGGAVGTFALDRQTGCLTPLQETEIPGDGACHAAVSPRGRHLIVTNYYSGSVLCFALLPDGWVGPLCERRLHSGGSRHPRQKSPHAHCAVFTQEGILAAADLGCDQIFLYELDEGTGALTPYAVQPSLRLPQGTGPRSILFHPNGRTAYICGELSSQIIVCAWDEARLLPQQTVSLRPKGLSEDTLAGGMTISPDGRFLYAALRLWDGLFYCRIDPAGDLSAPEPLPCGGRHIRTLACSPEGSFLLIPYQESGTLSVCRRDPRTGALSEETGTAEIPAVSFVMASDGENGG